VEKERERIAKKNLDEEENKRRLQNLAESRRLERLREILINNDDKYVNDNDDNAIIIDVEDHPKKTIRDELDFILQDLDDDEETVYKIKNTKKDPRPESWRAIAELCFQSNLKNVILAYPELAQNSDGEMISQGGIESRVRRWKKDYTTELRTGQPIDVTYGGRCSYLGDLFFYYNFFFICIYIGLLLLWMWIRCNEFSSLLFNN